MKTIFPFRTLTAVAALLSIAGCAMPRFNPREKPVPLSAEFLDMPGGVTKAVSLNLAPEDIDYTVGAGDKLEIGVVELPETRALTMVMPDGMLYFDVAAGVMAEGMTLRELEDALGRQIEETYPFAIVSATVVEAQSRSFTVLGQVLNPGSYSIQKPTRLLDAIALAGGQQPSLDEETPELADLGRSVLIRDGEIMPVDFRKLIEGGDWSQNAYVKKGDYIFLPPGGREKVYVLGAVNEPVAVPYSSRVSLIHALAAAKGLKPGAYGIGSLVIRGSFHEPQVARVNLKDVFKGKATDFSLQPGDIVWVPKRPWHKLETYLKYGLKSAASSYALRESSEIFFDGVVDSPTVTPASAAASGATSAALSR